MDRGFVAVPTSGIPATASLVLSAKDDAQIGSFGMVIRYIEYSAGTSDTALCQMHLSIASSRKRTGSRASSRDALHTIPTNLRSQLGGSSSVVSFTPAGATAVFSITLQRGSTGSEVMRLQERLASLGFFPAETAPTGFFGPITEGAVQKFQSAHGLEMVGIVGPKTRALLNG